MKKIPFLFVMLFIAACDPEIPNKLTTVEGIVSDYYTKKPMPEIPVLVIEVENLCFINCEDIILDTIYPNNLGYYYYEFYNKEYRRYTVSPIKTDNYFQNFIVINEGTTNKINLPLKQFKTLHLNFINKYKTYNEIFVNSYLDSKDYSCRFCKELTTYDFKIVPEQKHKFRCKFYHINEENKVDKQLFKDFEFFTGKNDTTINYYY